MGSSVFDITGRPGLVCEKEIPRQRWSSQPARHRVHLAEGNRSDGDAPVTAWRVWSGQWDVGFLEDAVTVLRSHVVRGG